MSAAGNVASRTPARDNSTRARRPEPIEQEAVVASPRSGRGALVRRPLLVAQPQRNVRRQQNTIGQWGNRTGIVERLSTSTWPYRRDDRQATTYRRAYGADDSATVP